MDHQTPPKRNSFATASLIFGILSLLTLGTIFLPIPLAALSILFAVLAHRKGKKIKISCLVGFASSAVSLIIAISVVVITLAMLPAMLKIPEYRKQLDYVSEQIYGESFDEMFEELYGFDIDEVLDNRKE